VAHFPVNHQLRPLYRTLATLAAVYMLVVGVVGFLETDGLPMFTRDETEWVLGLRMTRGFALLSLVAGAVVLLANLIGRNIGHQINQLTAIVLTVIGMVMLGVMQTDANVLGFSMVNVIVTFVLAIVIGTASLYDRVGSVEAAKAEEAFRHGR
jgi:hypothetical protein